MTAVTRLLQEAITAIRKAEGLVTNAERKQALIETRLAITCVAKVENADQQKPDNIHQLHAK